DLAGIVAPDQVDDRDEHTCGEQVRAYRFHEVHPAPTHLLTVRVDPPRHPHEPRHVHRQEGQIHTDEHHPEVELSQPLGEHPPGQFRVPEVDPGEEGEDEATDEDVMKVGDQEVAVVHLLVEGHRRDHDPGDAAQYEDRDEAEHV